MKCSYLSKRIVIACMAMCLFVMTAVGVSLAYYTDTSNASGSVPFSTSPSSTKITETFEGTNKDIRIENKGKIAVMVRLKVDCPSSEFATVSMGSPSENWVRFNPDDGWVYYAQPLMADESTENFDVNVVPQESATEFKITVTQDHAVAYYNEDGNLCANFGDNKVSFVDGSYGPVGNADAFAAN